jgi:hypothetical protein
MTASHSVGEWCFEPKTRAIPHRFRLVRCSDIHRDEGGLVEADQMNFIPRPCQAVHAQNSEALKKASDFGTLSVPSRA